MPERAIVRPRIVLALGASAARGMLGRTLSVSKARGAPIMLDDGAELWVTVHPSYLLRLDGEAQATADRAVRRRSGRPYRRGLRKSGPDARRPAHP